MYLHFFRNVFYVIENSVLTSKFVETLLPCAVLSLQNEFYYERNRQRVILKKFFILYYFFILFIYYNINNNKLKEIIEKFYYYWKTSHIDSLIWLVSLSNLDYRK